MSKAKANGPAPNAVAGGGGGSRGGAAAKGGGKANAAQKEAPAPPQQQQHSRKKGGASHAGDTLQQQQGGGKGGRGQQQQQGGAKGGQPQQQHSQKGSPLSAASAKMTSEYMSKYPRLELDAENQQLVSLTALIDQAFDELNEVRNRLEVLQSEQKELANKNRESMDTKHDAGAIREKAKQDREALRKQLDQQINARKRRLEELNKAKANLPVKLNIKDSKKLVAINMEQLDDEVKAIEAKIKAAATTGQDRAHSKDLQAIAQKKRIVREWAKQAEEAEAPVDPALEAKVKQADELVKKLIEEERETRKDVDRYKEALNQKKEELKAVKAERQAISEKIEKLKKDRDVVYATIRDKKKEHREQIKQLQKEERDKKAQVEQEKRQKMKKEKLEKQIKELSDAFKEELAVCDRLTQFLTNRQSKQKKDKTENSAADTKDQEVEEQNKNEEVHDDKEEEAEDKEAVHGEETGAAQKKGFQFSIATHIDFELLSVRPPTSFDEIPASLESIARKKALYERLAAAKLEQRKKVEGQLSALLSGEEPASKRQSKKQVTENGTASPSQNEKPTEEDEQAEAIVDSGAEATVEAGDE